MEKWNWIGFFWRDIFKRAIPRERSRIDFLKSTPFFLGFSDRQIELTNEFLHERQFAKEEHIFEIGHPGAALYLIESGEIAIEIPQEKSESIRVATLAAGSFFGELALIDEAPRSASARALVDTKVLALPRSELDRMREQSPHLGAMVYRSLAQITSARLKSTLERLQNEEPQMKMVVNG